MQDTLYREVTSNSVWHLTGQLIPGPILAKPLTAALNGLIFKLCHREELPEDLAYSTNSVISTQVSILK